jgi:hypothetical protein
MKTMDTTEEVSLDDMEKHVERLKCQRNAPFAREKPWANRKNELQIYGTGAKSQKRPTLVAGQEARWEIPIKKGRINGRTN